MENGASSNPARMKKHILLGLAVVGMSTGVTAPAQAGVVFGFHFGIPIPVPHVTIAPSRVVLPPLPLCPPPVVTVRPPVVYCPPPVAYCPPAVVVAPRYVRPYPYSYGYVDYRGGHGRYNHR